MRATVVRRLRANVHALARRKGVRPTKALWRRYKRQYMDLRDEHEKPDCTSPRRVTRKMPRV